MRVSKPAFCVIGEIFMQVKEIALSELVPYEKNPRRNDKAVNAVAKSIKQFGFKVPVVIDADNKIVAGHVRYKAARILKFDKIPCIIASDLTPEQAKAFRLIKNKTSELARWDYAKLSEELNILASELVGDFNFDLPNQKELPEFNSALPTVREKSEFDSITFAFSAEQKEFVDKALSEVPFKKIFNNTNKNGNALYEIVKQWMQSC